MQLRAIWQKYSAFVPRIPQATDPEAALVNVLGMTPSSSSTIARSVLGPEYSFAFSTLVRSDLTAEWWTNLAAQVRTDGSSLAAAMAKTRLANATYISWHRACPMSSSPWILRIRLTDLSLHLPKWDGRRL